MGRHEANPLTPDSSSMILLPFIQSIAFCFFSKTGNHCSATESVMRLFPDLLVSHDDSRHPTDELGSGMGKIEAHDRLILGLARAISTHPAILAASRR